MNILSMLPDTPVFTWFILPVLIFFFRIMDVSVGTLRIIFVSRGKRSIAPVLGFFEVSIWLIAISQIMQNLNNLACFFAYAGGFAMGNFIGIFLEDKLALGTLIVRIIISSNESKIQSNLYDAGFGVTIIDAHGSTGNVKIVYTVIKRRDLTKVTEIINKCDLNAFYSIEEAKAVRQGIFPADNPKSFFSIHSKKKIGYMRHGK